MTMQEHLRTLARSHGQFYADAADHIDQLEADKAELVAILARSAEWIENLEDPRYPSKTLKEADRVLAKHRSK